MIETMTKEPIAYLQRIKSLFAEVEQWSAAKGLRTERGRVQLNEEAYGQYPAETLRILSPEGAEIAEMQPIGASIIGAKGRVDLVGTVDRAILVDLDRGGPSISLSVRVGQHIEQSRQPIYCGVDEAAWYWAERGEQRQAHRLDRQTLEQLIERVSGYAH